MARCCGERAALRRRASPTLKRWIRLYSRSVVGRMWSLPSLVLQLLFLGDDFLHDLRGAGADGAQANIAPHAPDGIFRGVGEATHDLHAVVGHFLREVGSIELGHG